MKENYFNSYLTAIGGRIAIPEEIPDIQQSMKDIIRTDQIIEMIETKGMTETIDIEDMTTDPEIQAIDRTEGIVIGETIDPVMTADDRELEAVAEVEAKKGNDIRVQDVKITVPELKVNRQTKH